MGLVARRRALGFRTLRARLTIWFVALLAALLAAFSGIMYLSLRHTLYAGLDDSLESRTVDLAGLAEFDRGRLTFASSPDSEPPDLGDAFVRIFDASGTVVFSQSAGGDAPLDPGGVRAAIAGEPSSRSISIGGVSLRARTSPLEVDGVVRGAIEVGRSEEAVRDALRRFRVVLVIALPVGLLFAAASGAFLARRALRPIDALTRLARRISAEELGERLDRELPDDEVGRLARTFNEMLDRLDLAFRREREFTADASHELRTPLTVLRGEVDVTLSREREGPEYRRTLATVRSEVETMTAMVDDLLTLARSDAGSIAVSPEPIDISKLLHDVATSLQPVADQKGIDLQVADAPSPLLLGDERLLRRLFVNLVDNGIKFTPPGGTVSVTWRRDDMSNVAITVRDTGIGISQEHLEHLFDRFYRVDRSRARGPGGSGLGLAIARWIASAHGGRIAVQSAAGVGSEFTVHLPVGGPEQTLASVQARHT